MTEIKSGQLRRMMWYNSRKPYEPEIVYIVLFPSAERPGSHVVQCSNRIFSRLDDAIRNDELLEEAP